MKRIEPLKPELIRLGFGCAKCHLPFETAASPSTAASASKINPAVCWVCAAREMFPDDDEFGRAIVLHDPLVMPRLRYRAALAWFEHHAGAYYGDALKAWIARQECKRLVRLMREDRFVRVAIRHPISRRAVARSMFEIATTAWDEVVSEEMRISELARRDGWCGADQSLDAIAREFAYHGWRGYLAEWMRATAPRLAPYQADMERAQGFP